jgi:hypothetical protein
MAWDLLPAAVGACFVVLPRSSVDAVDAAEQSADILPGHCVVSVERDR